MTERFFSLISGIDWNISSIKLEQKELNAFALLSRKQLSFPLYHFHSWTVWIAGRENEDEQEIQILFPIFIRAENPFVFI